MKTKLRILNFFYFLISAAAIFFFATTPFFTTNFDYKLDEQVIVDYLNPDIFEDFGVSMEDFFEEEEEITFKMSIVHSHNLLLSSWMTTDANEFVEEVLLKPNIQSVLDDDDDLETVLTNIATSSLKAMFVKNLDEDLSEIISGDEVLETKLESAGHSYNELKASATILTNYLVNSATTVEEVATEYAIEYNKFAGYLGSGSKTASEFQSDLKTYLKMFKIANTRGDIGNIYDSIGALTERLLSREGGSTSDRDEASFAETLFPKLAAAADDEDEYDELTVKLATTINEQCFTEDFRVVIVLAIRLFSILLVFFIATWFIKIFQCFICLFRKTPYVRVEIFGIISNTLQLVLGLLTVSSIVMVKTMPEHLNQMPVIGDILPYGAAFSYSFSALIPAGLVIVNLLFSIVYNAVKRKFKRDWREDKETPVL